MLQLITIHKLTLLLQAAGAVGTDGASGEGFTVAIAHESGLTIGGGATKVGNTDARTGESGGTGYLKYSNGPLTVAYQEFYHNEQCCFWKLQTVMVMVMQSLIQRVI